MAWFSARTISASTVPVSAGRIWAVLTDPSTLAELTPLVRSIEPSGSHWRWRLHGVEAMGMRVEAAFTERMQFVDGTTIIFTHDPPPGTKERAAVDGVYDVTPIDADMTALRVDLTLSFELPLPRLSRPAVERVVLSTMRMTGQQFASNLYVRLGLDPTEATIAELSHP